MDQDVPEGCVTPRPFAARMCVRRVACRMPPMPPNGSLVHHMSRGRLHGQMHEVRTVVRSFRLPHSCQPALFLPLSHLCMCANVCVLMCVNVCGRVLAHVCVCMCAGARGELETKRGSCKETKRGSCKTGALRRGRRTRLSRTRQLRHSHAHQSIHDSHAHYSYGTLTHTKTTPTFTHSPTLPQTHTRGGRTCWSCLTCDTPRCKYTKCTSRGVRAAVAIRPARPWRPAVG